MRMLCQDGPEACDESSRVQGFGVLPKADIVRSLRQTLANRPGTAYEGALPGFLFKVASVTVRYPHAYTEVAKV
jgi:hypothetical protein